MVEQRSEEARIVNEDTSSKRCYAGTVVPSNIHKSARILAKAYRLEPTVVAMIHPTSEYYDVEPIMDGDVKPLSGPFEGSITFSSPRVEVAVLLGFDTLAGQKLLVRDDIHIVVSYEDMILFYNDQGVLCGEQGHHGLCREPCDPR